MKFLSNISLGRGTFSLVLLLYLFSLVILVPYKHASLDREIESQALEVVKREMFRLQQAMDAKFSKGLTGAAAESQILAMGLNSDITDLLLVSEKKQIIFSTKLAWKGRQLSEMLPDLKKEWFETIRLTNTADVIFSSDRRSISAIYPVSFPVLDSTLRNYKTGFLYLDYDLSRAKSAVWYRLIQENILGFLVSLFVAVILVFFVHRMASRPLCNLVAVSQKLAAGDLESRVGLKGAKELLQLEQAFNQMGSQLDDTHKALTVKTALYNVLSETNQSIVRIDNAESLFAEICRIAVELGDFKLAWIGLVDEVTGKVEPAASRGVAQEYLSKTTISINPELSEGRGATGQAIRENRYIVVNDFLKAPEASPWQKAAREVNIKSSAAFPILVDGKVVGALNVYAGCVGYFTQEVVELLCEMSRDISFALNNYKKEAERKQVEATLVAYRKILELVAAGEPLEKTMAALCRGVDSLLSEKKGMSSVQLLKKGKLVLCAAPGLPEGYYRAIDDLSIGPKVASCGTAAFLGRQVIVADIQTNSLWKDFRALAKQYGLEACWSIPVMTVDSAVMGVFSIYYPQPEKPDSKEFEIVDRFVHLIGLAIERVRSVDQIKQREENLSVTLDSIGDAVITVDVAGRVTRLNPVAETLTGWRAKEAHGRPLYEVFHIVNTQTRIKLDNPVEKVIMTGKIMGLANHTSLISKEGTEYQIADSAAPIMGSDGQLRGVILVFHDVTKQYALREELRLNHERLSAFNAVMPDLGFVFDEKGTYLEIYGAESGMLFSQREELRGKTVFEAIPAKMAGELMAVIHETLRTGESQIVEYELDVLDGQKYFEGRTAVLERDVNTGTGKVTWMARDITERKKAEEEIEQLAFYDPLTKLPNRRLLIDRLEHESLVVKRHQYSAALLFLDLDHFKTLNDSLGHSVGDSLLEQVAQRLSEQVRAEDTVARLGGDEFVVLLPELDENQEAAASHARMVAEKIQNALSAPFFLYEHEHHISASIGISLFSAESGSKAEDILKHADSAMYRSKDLGRNRICFYRPDMQAAADLRLRLEKDLRSAIRNDELEPFFQPQIDQQGNCVGLEVLLRWEHGEWGAVSPAEFIPVAEESGLILPMGEWVLRKSCQQIKAWQEQGLFCLSGEHFAVNVSPRQFAQDDFVEQVMAILDETKLAPSCLFIEVTEGMVIDGIDEAVCKMERLKEHGVRFSMDDFGTGYSSLSYLKQLPLDQLKIDRSFVMDIAHDESDRAIIDVILAVAERLNFNVVAEGVETESQLNYLTEKGCGTFQGYYFGKPMPASGFEKWIEENR